MWHAVIRIGCFGRVVETTPRRWRWLVRLEADLYCMGCLRETSYEIKACEKSDYAKMYWCD